MEDMVILKNTLTISLDALRTLSEKFSTATSPFQMDPEHEGPGGQTRTGRERFEELTDMQKEGNYFRELSAVKLVETHPPSLGLYWACQYPENVYLTPQGQYFWKLAYDGKI